MVVSRVGTIWQTVTGASGMTEKKEDLGVSRRSLLKKSLGVPLIFTLPSGAMAAAQSLNCYKRCNNEYSVSKPPPLHTATDKWVRKTLQTYTVTCTAQSGGKVYECYLLNGIYYTTSSNWPVPASYIQQVVTGPKKYGLVFLGSDGTISSIAPEPRKSWTSTPMTGSCYASLHPHNKPGYGNLIG